MKISKNTFEGGLNKDASPRVIPQNQYPSASNITLSTSAGFGTVSPIKGSTVINNLGVYSSVKVLNQFDTIFQYGGVEKACVVLIAILDSHYVIWCCPTDGSAPVKMYDETITNPNDYSFASGQVYSENGVDYLYFVDGVNQPRQLRCVITSPGSFTLLTKSELSVLKRAPLGVSISNFTINSTGGSLLCGSYPACVRMYNSVTNRYSAWTLPINPVRIHQTPASSTELHNGARGVATTKSITFTIQFNNSTEKALYTHYQIGVIENINSDTPAQTVSVLPVEALPVGASTTYTYKQNQKTANVSIDEVVIEPAPVETATALTIKDNRLFLGNIKYKPLDYDNGTPSFANTSSVLKFSASNLFQYHNWYADDDYSSRYVGHFREEVYRYAISYWDENYNFSPPSVLRMELVGNALGPVFTGGVHYDMKYPSRSTAGYELFDGSGMPQALGVRLVNLTNHPSWAKGFVILRAKRQENILFQTPYIPVAKLEPATAFYKYPIEARQSLPSTSGTRSRSDVPFDTAQPGINILGTYIPKNLFTGITLDIEQITPSGAATPRLAGQVRHSNANSNLRIGFPTGDMFQTPSGVKIDPYTPLKGDTVKLVDLALFKLNQSNSSSNDLSYELGDFVNTEVEGRFYADMRGDYYSTNLAGLSTGFSYPSYSLQDYTFVDNFDAGKTLDSGEPLEQYANILPTGFTDGFIPTTLRKAYFKTNASNSDPVSSMYTPARAGLGGGISGVADGTIFVNSTRIGSGMLFGGTGPEEGNGNSFVSNYSGWTNDTYTQGIAIANITRGLGDDRYGDTDTYQEFIYTGTSYEFSSSEVAQLQSGVNIVTNAGGVDVWGGDCFISYCQYKLTDTVFSVSDDAYSTSGVPQTLDTVADKFKYAFNSATSGTPQDRPRPVPLKATSQLVSCFIESKYNIDVQSRTGVYNIGINSNGVVKLTASGKEQYRLPLSYVIQPEYSFQNTYKVWIPKLTDIVSPTEYKSRLLVSDLKIYQSDVKGFDTFKALSYADLDETYGDIKSLLVSGDRMYGIQETAIVYIPINVAQIETADGATLSVSTDTVIGKTIYITNKYGIQNPKAVVAGDSGFYIADQNKGKIVQVNEEQLGILSDQGMIRTFESILTPSADTKLFYDNKARKLFVSMIIGGEDVRYIFDTLVGRWTTLLTIDSSATPSMFYSGGNNRGSFVVFGQYPTFNSNQLTYVKWEDNDGENSHLGVVMVPSMTVYLNQDVDIPKVYDEMIINSDNTLDTITFSVVRDDNFITQSTSATPVTDDRYESNYSIVILRDSNEERLRGSYLRAILAWPTAGISVLNNKLASVLLKYRGSKPVY